MPIANGFLTPEQFKMEQFSELAVGYCPSCHMVQLTELIEPSTLFNESYPYFSSTSRRMVEHFKGFAQEVSQRFGADPFVLEVGSNDGILLQNFARPGCRHLGVEPSRSVAEAAIQRGLNTTVDFFNEETARRLRAQHGPADAVVGANVICHIPAIRSLLAGVEIMLKPHGLFVFEEPYLGDIIRLTAYDQIYDEHIFYFSAVALRHVFDEFGLEIVDASPQHVHGGSMRWTIGRKEQHQPTPAAERLIEREIDGGLTEAGTYQAFAQRVASSRTALVQLLEGLKQDGKRITGYGATSKSTTTLNYCGIGPDIIDFISDTTPAKQGRFSPGRHIPIKPYEAFKNHYPDYALLLAWNHGEEIIANEGSFLASGGRFISYVPTARVLEPSEHAVGPR